MAPHMIEFNHNTYKMVRCLFFDTFALVFSSASFQRCDSYDCYGCDGFKVSSSSSVYCIDGSYALSVISSDSSTICAGYWGCAAQYLVYSDSFPYCRGYGGCYYTTYAWIQGTDGIYCGGEYPCNCANQIRSSDWFVTCSGGSSCRNVDEIEAPDTTSGRIIFMQKCGESRNSWCRNVLSRILVMCMQKHLQLLQEGICGMLVNLVVNRQI